MRRGGGGSKAHVQPHGSQGKAVLSTPAALWWSCTMRRTNGPLCLLFKAQDLLRGFWKARPRLLDSHKSFSKNKSRKHFNSKSHGEGFFLFRDRQQRNT